MDFNDILIRRRAINFFDPDRDVSEETLRAIVEDAVKAPSSYNLQPYKLKVFRDLEDKQALRALAFDQPKVTEAPVVLAVLADREGWQADNVTHSKVFDAFVAEGKMQQEQADWFNKTTAGLYGQSEAFIQAFANKNAGLFAMSLMYAATHHGLHSHPMDGFDHDAVKKAFSIPDQYWIPMLIAVGHIKPGVDVPPKGWRQSYDEVVLD